MRKIISLLFITSLALCYSNVHAIIVDGSNDIITNDIANKNKYLLTDIDTTSHELAQALDALREGKQIRAKQLIAKILTEDPTNVPALHLSGIMFLEEKRYDNAQVAFEAALKSGVKNPAILSKLGVTRILQGDRQKGKRLLNYALTLDPNNQLALSYLAWLAETDGQYGLAISHLQTLLKTRNSDQLNEIHISIARLYSKSGDHKAVVKLLSPFINNKKQPDNQLKKQASAYLIESYIQTSRFQEAEALLKKSSANASINEVQAAVFKIDLLIKQKKYKNAEAFVDKTAKKLPEQAHVIHYAAAQSFTKANKLNKAIEQMSAVVTILDSGKDKNRLFSAINDLTALYVKATRKIDALQLVQKYADKYPDNTLMIYQLAELQASVGQYAQANKNIDKLIRLSPKSINAYYLKGIIARRQKQLMNAEKWFSKVNRMEPRYEQAWIQRSGSYVDAGNLKQAITVMSYAVKENQTSPVLWFEYGALLTDAGRHEEAAKAYKTVLNYQPSHLPSIDNLAGSLLIIEKNPPEALFYAERAYNLNPTDSVLQLNYLEALLQNKRYKDLLDLARKLQPNLKTSARFNYYVGAAQYHTGNKTNAIKKLNLAKSDDTLDKRYRIKIDSLLKTN